MERGERKNGKKNDEDGKKLLPDFFPLPPSPFREEKKIGRLPKSAPRSPLSEERNF